MSSAADGPGERPCKVCFCVKPEKRSNLSLLKSLCQRNRFKHRLCLVHRFLIFALWHRIIDPSASGLNIRFAILEQRSADGNATVQIPVEREIAYAAPIR